MGSAIVLRMMMARMIRVPESERKVPVPAVVVHRLCLVYILDIGEHLTRHDLIVAYMTKLTETSDRASIYEYGKTFRKPTGFTHGCEWK